MSEMRILNAQADRALTWDAELAEAGDPAALAAVREAERIFEAQRRRGATAFAVAADTPARQLDAFDPKTERIIVLPQVAGG